MGLFCLWPPFEVSPCTLFGAFGNSVEGGGVRGSEREGQVNIIPNYRCLAPIFHGLTIYKWRKYDRMLLKK